MAMQDIFSNFDFQQGLLNLYNPQGAERRRNRLKEEELQTKRQAAVAQMVESMGTGFDERQQLKQDAAQLSDVITAAPSVSDTQVTSEGDVLPLPAPITGAELDTLRSFDKEKENIESGQDRSGNMFNLTDESVGKMREMLKGLPASDAIDVVRGALSTSLSERIKDQFKEKKEKEFRVWSPEEKAELGIPEYEIGGSHADDPKKFVKMSEMEKGVLPPQPKATQNDKLNAIVTKYPDAFPLKTNDKGESQLGSINFNKITSKKDKTFVKTLMLQNRLRSFDTSSVLADLIQKRSGK